MSPDNPKALALAHLRQILKPGDTLHGIQRHRSRSGKSRSISLLATAPGGQLEELDVHIACALGMSLDRKHGGIRTDAPGDELVFNLSRVLFPDGGAALVFRRI